MLNNEIILSDQIAMIARLARGSIGKSLALYHKVFDEWGDAAKRLEDEVKHHNDLEKNMERHFDTIETQRQQLAKQVDTLKEQNARLNEALLDTREANDELREELSKALKKQSDETERADSNFRNLTAAQVDLGKVCRELDGMRRVIDGYQQDVRTLTDQLATARAKSAGLSDELARVRNAYEPTAVSWTALQHEGERIKLLQRNENQKHTIEGLRNELAELQKEARDFKQRLEAERGKPGPVQDLYRNAQLEVRLVNGGAVEVLEYGAPGQHSRLRSTTEVVDLRTKVARREVELSRWQRKASVTEYDQWNRVLTRHNNVPVKVN